MNSIDTVCALLAEKKNLFLQVEKTTLAILDSDADSAEQYIIQRDMLATEIEALNETIARECDKTPDCEGLISAAYARQEFAKVPSEYQCVYYAAQDVRSVGNRILESEKQVLEKLTFWRDEALNAIKQNQNMPKIKKYLTDLSAVPPGGELRNEKV